MSVGNAITRFLGRFESDSCAGHDTENPQMRGPVCPDFLYHIAEFSAVAYFWHNFRRTAPGAVIWMNPTPCNDGNGGNGEGEENSGKDSLLRQLPPLGETLYYTSNYTCKENPRLETICDALQEDFRNRKPGGQKSIKTRQPDGLAFSEQGWKGEIFEVTTEKAYRRNRSAKAEQLRSGLYILRQHVNGHVEGKNMPPVEWIAAPRERRLTWPIWLSDPGGGSPYFRWICYKPNQRDAKLPDGWALYEIHKSKLPVSDILENALESVTKLALGAALYKKLADFFKKHLPEIGRRLRPAMESVLETAEWLRIQGGQLLSHAAAILMELGPTIMMAALVLLIGVILVKAAPVIMSMSLAVAIALALLPAQPEPGSPFTPPPSGNGPPLRA